MEIKLNNFYIVNHDCEPLFRKGDRFKVIKLNEDKNMLPITAVNFRGEVLGFEENELEECR